MRSRHRVAVLATAVVAAALPATAAADAPATGASGTPPAVAGPPPLLSVNAGLSLNLLGINITLGAPPPPPPTVADGQSLVGLSLTTQVGVNVGSLSAQVDAKAGATVSSSAGAAVTVDAHANVPGVIDTGLAGDLNVPGIGSTTPPSGSLHIRGLDQAATPASGSTGVPAAQRPGAAVAGSQTPSTGSSSPTTSASGSPAPSRPSVGTPRPTVQTPGTRPRRPAQGGGPDRGTRAPAGTGLRTPVLGPDLGRPLAAIEVSDLPVSREVLNAAVATGRTLALPLALLAALLAYLGLQRLLDRGPKLAWANGRTPPDDELLEL